MNILLIDTIHPHFISRMKEERFECTDGTQWNQGELLNRIHQFDGLVIRSRIPVDRELLSKAVKLKFIARAGSGMENIDTEEAIRRGIPCLNAPEGNRDAVAEHITGMLLALMNRITIADRQMRQGIWSRESNRGEELSGKTVGIIGFGNTGSAFAKKLSGFGCPVLAFDKYVQIDTSAFPHVSPTGLNEICNHADVISLHIPLTAETMDMVNDAFFEKCRKPVWFINSSRGKIVRTSAIVNALKSGKIKGACLDVFDFEDVSFEQALTGSDSDFEYLRNSDRVILTPHIAGWTHESNLKIASALADKIIRLLKG